MQIIKTPDVPAAIGPYSQGVVSNGFLFTHGVLPLDKDTGLLVGDTIEEQAEQVLKNMLALIKAGGSDECHIVKTNVFITDMSKFAAFNAVYAKYFKQDYPARACVEVAALAKGALVEMEAIAEVCK
ncbi:MAG: RidA family protein [Lachnospiraceae bacterium]|nr:RidA family protein [Lachnospiraceae bacterium]